MAQVSEQKNHPLDKIPFIKLLIGAAVTVAVATAGAFFFISLPMGGETESLKQQITEARKNLISLTTDESPQGAETLRSDLQETLNQAKARADLLSKPVPAKNIPGLIDQIVGFSKNLAGFTLVSATMEKQAQVAMDGMSASGNNSVDIMIKGEGSYKGVIEFLSGLRLMSFPMYIQKMALAAGREETGKIKVDIILQVLVAQDAGAGQAVAP